MSKTLYLIDGHAQIYRAYYARMGNLTSPSGEPTRATYVFCQMLLSLIRDRRPDYLAVAMDVSDETVFRRDIYPDYKAQRELPPEDFPLQRDRILSILEAARIPILRAPGFEADDIMATVATRYAGESFTTYLVSKDKDLEQLISDKVLMYDPAKDEVIDAERLKATRGWSPDQAIEAQTLCGDTVDNVPGVKGIGPKTAAKLIAKYGTARGVIEHAEELTPKQRENVLAFAPMVDTTRQLLRLRTDVPIELDLEAARVDRFDWAVVVPILRELGFRRLVEQLPIDEASSASNSSGQPAPNLFAEAAATDQQADKGDYKLINTPDALDRLLGELSQQSAFAIDTETTSTDPIDATLVGVSLAWRAGHGFYIPVRCVHGGALPVELLRDKLGPLLADGRSVKIGHNIKYDCLVLRQAGMPIVGPLFDTMIAAFVLDPAQNTYAMDRVVERTLGHKMIPISELIGKRGRDQLQMDQVVLDHVAEYAAEDADYTYRLYELYEPQLRGSSYDRLFYEIEMPLVRVLADMEYLGFNLDVELLGEMSVKLRERLEQITREAHALAGHPFNLDSPKQLAQVLFDEMGLRVVRRTKTSRSTDADTLQTLARETDSPLPKLLLEYRELQKLRSTYVEALPAARSKRTGRVHTSYHQTGAITGRLSSSEPNLQNIPVRTELGRQIRAAFIPSTPDDLLIVADYSQVELRVMAHFSGDEALMRAFAEDRDIHAFVAAQVNGVPLEEVTREMRGRAKAVNFGIIYGQTAFGLAQATGMSRGDAQRFIDEYFARYPRVRAFINACIEQARERGYVETLFGRRRPIRDINSRNNTARAAAERLAVNTVIQGSAADLIKLAMVRLHARIGDERLALRMLLQVHDELVCEAPAERADAMAEIVAETMCGAAELRVPLKVDVATGRNWLEAK